MEISHCWFTVKDVFNGNGHMKRCTGWSLEGSWERDLLSLWSAGVPYFLCRWVYQHSNYESHNFKMFMEASAHRHDGSLAQPPAPLASPEDRELGGVESSKLLIMVWFSGHQSPSWNCTGSQSPLFRTKDILLTQKIPSDLRALCQELKSKTKY